ncbi:hypothetical protein PGT21_013078 [Puccinia graminis f. sp. tritici]|uniref:Uncharacterized protein n=1 Tax=Puccinia graminis f. sp. tritici TaxID=56615 RepID=A0A5B0RZP6_PUCGR|nr:hypothetical protein PGT21_013078 [Puccinia graminis f. sp. tritici]KAA1131536.1 hypothetical protein PGTUg99_028787 [Puccinia graminis f. sp. tritici]
MKKSVERLANNRGESSGVENDLASPQSPNTEVLEAERNIRRRWEGPDGPADWADVAEEGETYSDYMDRILEALELLNSRAMPQQDTSPIPEVESKDGRAKGIEEGGSKKKSSSQK